MRYERKTNLVTFNGTEALFSRTAPLFVEI